MKVLELGTDDHAKSLWPDAQIDNEVDGKYDAVLASHVLTKIPYTESQLAVNEWAELLGENGELHIVVPSLEWACWEMIKGDPPSSVIPHIFGVGAPNLAGFTMPLLRSIMELTGLKVVRARTGKYSMVINEKEYEAFQHYVMGTK